MRIRLGLHLVFQIISLLWLTKTLTISASLGKPGCQVKCGGVQIPYPFGIGINCFMDEWFDVDCRYDNSSRGQRPFLRSVDLEVREISLYEGRVEVNSPVMSLNCPKRESKQGLNLRKQGVNSRNSPFTFSATYNRFIAVGCNNIAIMTGENNSTIGGCMSFCDKNRPPENRFSSGSTCYGINCCQTTIPLNLQAFNVNVTALNCRSVDNITCTYAFLVNEAWLRNTSHLPLDPSMVKSREHFPAMLEWAMYNRTKFDAEIYHGNYYCYPRSANFSLDGIPAHLCDCMPGYDGNPYLGCEETTDCNRRRVYGIAHVICNNALKSRKKFKMVITGVSTGVGILLLLTVIWWLYKVIKKRYNIKRKEKFFKRNGGLLLKQQLSTSNGSVEKTKLYDSEELEKATDHYNDNRILGQGGQGTVYKGMLSNGRIVAIKKSKIVDEGKTDQFVNEVVILSQINHRNVVKLLGCCLETEVPLLVYEFISNGTLFQHIHDQNEDVPFSWEMRLRIATEVAGALSYLHSATSVPIFHRDIKSTNILLDDKYKAKVSDFGTSRSISVDQTHLTTLVQGTFGYLDPEYFQSSQFTDKSDVYSFGVVLVELLTGEKPISLTRSQEGRSLATYFIQSMEENHLFDILHARVQMEGTKEEIIVVARLAKRCLNLNGKKRPTMKEVVMELEGIKGGPIAQQNQEVERSTIELTEAWEVASTSTGTFCVSGTTTFPDDQPFLFSE